MKLNRVVMIVASIAGVVGCSGSTEVEDEAVAEPAQTEVAANPVAVDDAKPQAMPEIEGMVLIPQGTFAMGSAQGYAHEGPIHEITLDSFYMDTHEVTNRQFRKFINETGYVTEAEQWKWSIVFAPDDSPGQRVPGAEWWKRADGAMWLHPNGPDTDIEGLEDYPVVQVSWNDAVAYAKWIGKRLPTEAEWEYAAQGGLDHPLYPWGLDFSPGGKHQANTWNGQFPIEDSGEDGFTTLAPGGKYPANGYGLYDMAGNVWEWVHDWYGANYYRNSPISNPQGPGQGFEKVQRGGSFMCAENYCLGYRVSHRGKSGIDSGLPHTGFRCVRSAETSE